MLFDLNAIIGQIGRDKGIDRQLIIDAVETAMLSAAKKHFGHNLNLEAHYNEDTGEIEVLQFQSVVDHVIDKGTQISLEEARDEYDPEAMVGDEFGKKLDTYGLGRIAAQTAKQVIIQKVRDAERGVIFEEYKGSKGELINGIVQRYDKGNVIVNLGRTEAILPKREQIARERYRQGDRIRCMILDIDPTARGPQIILTRSHPEFLKKLFALEVPEIAENVIEIRSVAREPGERAKISVHSNDNTIDPVGACVGIKGSRVQAVVQELRGERIDIITWTPDEPSFVARALAPAEVAKVVVDEEDHSMEVIVNDDQLALAIGRRGQNVKLASKLSGWRIDVRSISVAEDEARRSRQSIEAIPDIGFTDAEMLFQAGYRSAKEIGEAQVDEIRQIEGFDEDKARDTIRKASEWYEDLVAQGRNEIIDDENSASELHKLSLSSELREKLLNLRIVRIQALMSLLEEDGAQLKEQGFNEDEIATIKESLESFQKGGAFKR